jgi:hypothetical protein
MTGFLNHRELIEAVEGGQSTVFGFRKAPTQVTGTNIWFDLSMSPGNPNPNYYAASPLVSKRLAQSSDGGIFHGASPGIGRTKHLRRLMALVSTPTTALPLPMILCDYLLYYPFVDMSSTDAQIMTQSESLTRYTDGAGVQMMAVEVASQIGGVQFNVQYTNSAGVAGRVTPTVRCNTQTSVGTIITTAAATAGCAGPFLPLQAGDTGVRSIEACTFLTGDVGLVSLVLVKPLATLGVYDLQAPAEKDFALDNPATLPRIEDDAYLNLICLPSGSIASGQILGTIETVWN